MLARDTGPHAHRKGTRVHTRARAAEARLAEARRIYSAALARLGNSSAVAPSTEEGLLEGSIALLQAADETCAPTVAATSDPAKVLTALLKVVDDDGSESEEAGFSRGERVEAEGGMAQAVAAGWPKAMIEEASAARAARP